MNAQMQNTEVEVVRRVYAIGAFFSLFGSCFIIFTFLYNRKVRTTTTFVVFLLAVVNCGLALMDSLSWFIYDSMLPFVSSLPSGAKDALCVIQGAGIQYFAISSFLWISSLAYHAFNILCRKKHEETLNSYLKYYFMINLAIPLIPVLICLITDSFGQTERSVWCWIKPTSMELRFGLYYVPLVVLWGFNVAMYILLSRERRSNLSYDFIIKEGKRRLRLYILVFILCKLPSLVNRSVNVILPDYNFFALFLLQALFDSLFGFFEALVFFYTMKKRISFLCCSGSHIEEKSLDAEPMIHRDSSFYSSIAERMYYKRPLVINN